VVTAIYSDVFIIYSVELTFRAVRAAQRIWKLEMVLWACFDT